MLESNYPNQAREGSTNILSEDTTMFKDSNFDDFNNVLLIEDNPGDARLVELLLGESDLQNCKVFNCTTLAAGLQALEERDNYAAILLDLSLPDSQGFETLERLLGRFPNNNVIVLTGHSDKSLGIRAVQAGAQDFLVKGAFDADLLSKSLRFSIERNSVLKRLEETQRIAHIGSWNFKLDQKEFTASDEFCRILGYEPSEKRIGYGNIQNENSPLYVFKEIQDAVILSKNTIKKDIEIQTDKGERRFIFIQCTINNPGSPNCELNGIIQDITDRKLSEQELGISQARYQDIFSKSKDAIFICSFDGKFIDFNQATQLLFDKNKVELQESNINKLIGPPEQLERLLNKLTDRETIKDFEIEVERPSGETRYCLITANRLDSDSKEDGYNAIVRDITERKQADELRKARDLARQSAEMKEQFIANISHEMRTPMNAILGMSNLVIKTTLNKEQYSYISSIKKSSEILLGIVNDILEIATLQKGKIKFEDKVFDLYELLENLINVMKYKMQEKALDFKLSFENNVPKYIKGDALRLNQILYNLMGNAVKFTDKGFVKLNVINLNQTEGIVQIKFIVEDSGIGMPKNKLDAIFETFTRIRTKDRLFEGTGLGLSIAKNLVENQGGKIGVSSTLGVGSKFYFDLIFELGTAGELITEEEDGVDISTIDEPIRLLLVEDHKMNQIVARKTLEKQWDNIDITIADNGKIAIDILKEKSFNIILMDLQMPIMDGYETTKYIREQMPEKIAKLPILAMTAHAYIAKDEKFKEYGMDDFILKPFVPEQLFQKIVKYVNLNKNSRHVNEC